MTAGKTMSFTSDPNEQQVRMIRGGGEFKSLSDKMGPLPNTDDVVNSKIANKKCLIFHPFKRRSLSNIDETVHQKLSKFIDHFFYVESHQDIFLKRKRAKDVVKSISKSLRMNRNYSVKITVGTDKKLLSLLNIYFIQMISKMFSHTKTALQQVTTGRRIPV